MNNKTIKTIKCCNHAYNGASYIQGVQNGKVKCSICNVEFQLINKVKEVTKENLHDVIHTILAYSEYAKIIKPDIEFLYDILKGNVKHEYDILEKLLSAVLNMDLLSNNQLNIIQIFDEYRSRQFENNSKEVFEKLNLMYNPDFKSNPFIVPYPYEPNRYSKQDRVFRNPYDVSSAYIKNPNVNPKTPPIIPYIDQDNVTIDKILKSNNPFSKKSTHDKSEKEYLSNILNELKSLHKDINSKSNTQDEHQSSLITIDKFVGDDLYKEKYKESVYEELFKILNNLEDDEMVKIIKVKKS